MERQPVDGGVKLPNTSNRISNRNSCRAHFFCAECLTNAARYAPGAATAIDIEFSESEVKAGLTRGNGAAVGKKCEQVGNLCVRPRADGRFVGRQEMRGRWS